MNRRIIVTVFLVPALLLSQSTLTVEHPVYGGAVFAPGSLADLVSARSFCGPPASIVLRTADREFGTTVVSPTDFCSTTLRIALPADVPPGYAEIVANIGGQEHEPIPLTIVRSRFGFLPLTPLTDRGEPMSLTRPVLAGTTLTLRGTGLGDATALDMKITLAGQLLTPESIYPATDEPGIDEIRFRLPSVLRFDGCYVPTRGSVRDQAVNRVNLAVAQTAGPCRHPLGLSADQLTVLDEGRAIALGVADSTKPLEWAIDRTLYSYRPYFTIATAARVAWISGPQHHPGLAECSMESSTSAGWPVGEYPIQLDAGTAKLAGPHEQGVEFIATKQPLLEQGDWELRTEGGKDIGPVVHRFSVPPLPRLLNVPSEFSYGLDQELRLRWEVSGYGVNDEMTLTLSTALIPGLALNCAAPAASGTMVLPLGALLLASTQPSPEQWPASLSATIRRRPGTDFVYRFRLKSGTEASGIIRYPSSINHEILLREGAR